MQLVGRNETAIFPNSYKDLVRSHSDVYFIGGVHKPLQLRCEGREAHSALRIIKNRTQVLFFYGVEYPLYLARAPQVKA